MTQGRTLSSKKRSLGLSMIETVAALTILASGAVIIFSWTAQTTGVLARADLTEKRQLARLRALDFLRTINPNSRPNGQQRLDNFSLSWASRPIDSPQHARDSDGRIDSYELTMYAVKAVLAGQPEIEGLSMELELPGYRLTRRLDPGSLFQNDTR
jgi:hypothetical protein